LGFRHVPVQTGGAGFDRDPKVQELVARYIISMKGYPALEKIGGAIAGTES